MHSVRVRFRGKGQCQVNIKVGIRDIMEDKVRVRVRISGLTHGEVQGQV